MNRVGEILFVLVIWWVLIVLVIFFEWLVWLKIYFICFFGLVMWVFSGVIIVEI